MAGVVILGLLGGLAVFDSLNRPPAPALPKMAALPEPPPVVQTAEAEKTEKPAEEEAEGKAEEEKEKLAAAETVPERSETPIAKPLTAPATARPATVKPSEPAMAPTRPDARRDIARTAPPAVSGVPEATRPPQAPASRPLVRALESSAQRFLVQVGVFSNPANAEELLQKIRAAGIPAQIESRVQVGPFATRAEVDAAREKLKTLGIDDGILVRR